jgi:small subunit ribosomal protein S20
MPNIKSAKKRMELSRTANLRNRAKRSRLRGAIKRVRGAADAGEARERLQEAISLLDRAARTRLMHPNRAARIKSRLAQHVNGMAGAA